MKRIKYNLLQTKRIKKALRLFSFLFIATIATGSLQAQETAENQEFNRNGRWLVETGYNIISGLTSGGTGLNFIVDDDGESLTSLGGEIGKFTSENFALKFRFGLLSSGGFSITNIGIGGKYYIGGNVPLDFGAGVFSGGGNSAFQANLSIGYAINVAPNITFEPSLGTIIGEDGALINFKMGFAMFL